MASASQVADVRPLSALTGRNGLLDKYFYFAMSLLLTSIVIAGFSQSVGANLFYATVRKPLLLWFHGGAFSAWMLFYILQSALVRIRKVSWHRLIGWFGAALAASMVALGLITAVVMARFDIVMLHLPAKEMTAFLSVPFYDMITFFITVGLAISWRKKPELHRRLLLIATCGLMDAAFGRFAYLFNHDLYFPLLDGLILLGVGRDLLVNKKVNRVYTYAMPLLITGQLVAVYLYRAAPEWWLRFGHSLIGV